MTTPLPVTNYPDTYTNTKDQTIHLYSPDVYNNIITKVNNMNKHHTLEILNILYTMGGTEILNENQYGTFVNLGQIDHRIIDELIKYINYADKQEENLQLMEKKQNECKKIINLYSPTESNIGKSPLSCDTHMHHPSRVYLNHCA